MSDTIEQIMLEQIRALRAELAFVKNDIREIKTRLAIGEANMADKAYRLAPVSPSAVPARSSLSVVHVAAAAFTIASAIAFAADELGVFSVFAGVALIFAAVLFGDWYIARREAPR